METTTASASETPIFDVPSVEETAQRVRAYNERLIESSKSAGLVALDSYDKAVASLTDLEKRIGSSTQLDWVGTLTSTHAKFVDDVNTAYTRAARELLK